MTLPTANKKVKYMKTWQEIKESPNYRRLKESVEMKFSKRCAILYAVLTGFCALMVAAPTALADDPAVAAMTITFMLMVLLPFPIFYIYRIFKIYSHMDDYTFTECLLDKPHGGWGRDTMYFDVKVRDRFGAEIPTETHAIFATRGEFSPLLEDYINKKVVIGYNNVTEYVVVIG